MKSKAFASLLLTTFLFGCTSSLQNARIYGGYPTDITHAPYMVHVVQVLETLPNGQSKVYSCGGTIVRTNLILTAAHCVTNDADFGLVDADAYLINSGANKKDLTDGDLHYVQTVYRHPEYKGGHEHHFFHDVGMLQLKDNIVLSNKAQLVTLAQRNDRPKPGTDGTITGYGSNPDHPTDQRLYQVHISVISAKQCTNELAGGTVDEVDKHQICAEAEGKNQCEGDSGGPLHDTTTDRQIGIVSYGEKNCSLAKPSILARVTDNLDFIDKIIKKSSPTPVAQGGSGSIFEKFSSIFTKPI